MTGTKKNVQISEEIGIVPPVMEGLIQAYLAYILLSNGGADSGIPGLHTLSNGGADSGMPGLHTLK